MTQTGKAAQGGISPRRLTMADSRPATRAVLYVNPSAIDPSAVLENESMHALSDSPITLDVRLLPGYPQALRAEFTNNTNLLV